MSILIRGMEMPTSCVNCRFSGFGGLRNERVVCMHTGSNAYMNEVQYLDDCPLVPVPPHGALIDRDDFFATCPELVDGYKRISDDFVVIPAEEAE